MPLLKSLGCLQSPDHNAKCNDQHAQGSHRRAWVSHWQEVRRSTYSGPTSSASRSASYTQLASCPGKGLSSPRALPGLCAAASRISPAPHFSSCDARAPSGLLSGSSTSGWLLSWSTRLDRLSQMVPPMWLVSIGLAQACRRLMTDPGSVRRHSRLKSAQAGGFAVSNCIPMQEKSYLVQARFWRGLQLCQVAPAAKGAAHDFAR